MKRLKYFALAALVAFAACDEGDEVVTPTPITGSITGVVSIDGSGAAGVTVTLSSGATATTGSNGSYTFTNVAEGAYTVSISGFPSDAAFPTTSKAAVISSAGQVQNVDFAGSFITTSAISVSVGGPQTGPLSGATVSLSGQASASQTTGTSGTVNFSGLRAGTYTVAVSLSAGDAALYDLNQTSQSVSVGLDELASVSFTATPKTISSISGSLFIDEVVSNDLLDTSEEKVAAAGIDIIVEGSGVGVFDTIQTDANGDFTVTGLPASNYRVSVDLTDSDIPGALTYGASDNATRVFTLGVADEEVLDFPFDIATQQVVVGAFLGADENNGPAGVAPRVTPIGGVTITLYPTQADAVAETNSLGSGATASSTGLRTISFARSADYQPANANVSDNIVFAKVDAADLPAAPLSQNGESIIEIPFSATDSLKVADDVFDFLNSQVTVSFRMQEIDGDRYNGLRAQQFTDTTAADFTAFSNADGIVYYDLTATDEYFFTFNETQQDNLPQPGIPNWPSPVTLSLDAAAGGSAGSFLTYDFDGTVLPSDTIFVGTINLTWDLVDVRGRVHRETNDQGTVPTWQPATEVDFNGPNLSTYVTLQQDQSGTWATLGPPQQQPNASTGRIQNNGIASGESYRYVARSFNSGRAVLNDTIQMFAPDGSDQVVDICPLRDGSGTTFATCSTFAMKYQNNTISGQILYRDSDGSPDSPVVGVEVMISAADSTIQGRASSAGDTIVVTAADGTFTTNATVREGFYTITPMNDVPAAFFAATTNGAPKTVDVTGSMVNQAVPATAGFNATTPASFHAHRTDASIRGYVVNDRDQDGNTIDVDEALIGATVTLYADDGLGSVTTSADSIIGTATIGSDGLYLFEDLVTRRYIIAAQAPAGEVILSGEADPTDPYSVTVDNLDLDVNPPPTAQLPYWNYETSTVVNTGEAGEQGSYFTFLFTDGTYSGTVINDENGAGVGNMSLQLVRCANESPAPAVPTAGVCDSPEPGTFQNVLSNADGSYSFDGLREGIYQVTIQTASAGDGDGAFVPANTTGNGTTSETFVFLIDGRSDLEQIEFRVDN